MTHQRDCVLVIGVNLPLIRECIKRNYRVVVVEPVDGFLYGAEEDLSDSIERVVVENISDIGSVWGGLLRHFGDGLAREIDGVVCFDEFALATSAAVADQLGCAVNPLGTAVQMRDKLVQKNVVRRGGIRAASSQLLIPGSEEFLPEYRGKCVVKPISGGATTSTYAVDSAEEYQDRVRQLSDAKPGHVFVVEEFVDAAEEWVVDGVCFDGEMLFASVARYAETCLNFTTGHDPYTILRLDGIVDSARLDSARAVAAKALRRLGYGNGVFHMELFIERNTGDIYFGECAGRIGGAMTQESVQAKHGISLAACALDVSLGILPKVDSGTDFASLVASTSMHLSPGTVLAVPVVEELNSCPGLEAARVLVLAGQEVSHNTVRSTVDVQGVCVVSGSTQEELDERMIRVRKAFADKSVVAPTSRPGYIQRRFSRRVAARES